MIVGIPKEIKNNENRVSLTPAGAHELVQRGHTVYIQHTAGINSGFSDEEYEKVGARILPTIEDVYAIAEMIIKVKEPIECEYNLVRKGQLVFTYFHFACDKELTEAMMRSGSVCLAYETVTDKQGGLPLLIPKSEVAERMTTQVGPRPPPPPPAGPAPLLIPMSEVAGRMSTQEGARFLEKPQGGRGILLGGVPGVKPAKVLVLGGGIVGTNAALMAAGLGADVTICDISLPRLRQLSEFMPKNVKTLFSSSHNIEKELPTTDLIIGAVLIPGAKAPHLITRPMLKLMKKGTVLVDVAIDQGGCFETSHPTTHAEPIYEVDGIIHYCVANIPGAVPCTSTLALTNATLPYAIRLADLGWKKACENDPGLKNGLNIVNGKIVFPAVAEAFGWKI